MYVQGCLCHCSDWLPHSSCMNHQSLEYPLGRTARAQSDALVPTRRAFLPSLFFHQCCELIFGVSFFPPPLSYSICLSPLSFLLSLPPLFVSLFHSFLSSPFPFGFPHLIFSLPSFFPTSPILPTLCPSLPSSCFHCPGFLQKFMYILALECQFL